MPLCLHGRDRQERSLSRPAALGLAFQLPSGCTCTQTLVRVAMDASVLKTSLSVQATKHS